MTRSFYRERVVSREDPVKNERISSRGLLSQRYRARGKTAVSNRAELKSAGVMYEMGLYPPPESAAATAATIAAAGNEGDWRARESIISRRRFN